MLFPTTIVGSYPQPEWLIDRGRLAARMPPRVRARELWRIAPPLLAQAQDDATVVAIKAQEDAGIDIVTDGEIRRESYSNLFATALDGLDLDTPGTIISRAGHTVSAPRIVGPIRRRHAVTVEALRFLRAHTSRRVKMTLPGPFTMSQQAQNEYYADAEQVAFAYAEAVNEEIRELFANGADVVQIDEPYMQARPDEARAYGVAAVDRALHGVDGTTCVHVCFGYAALVHDRPSGYSFLPELASCRCRQVSIETAQSNLDCAVLETLGGKDILLGVIDLSTEDAESAETVAGRIERALPHVAAERIIAATDCGMKYLSRSAADNKMRALVAGAALARERHARSAS